MFTLFCQSLRRHSAWWLASFWPGKHAAAPLGGRRLLFLLLGCPLFAAVQLIHWLGFLIDEICFPAYRKVIVEAPVFIAGIPRSGTTFLHRTLAEDAGQFTTFTTWEAALAPSIAERTLLRALAALDRRIGSPGRRLVHCCLSRGTGDFHAIHEVGLGAPEEDYLALLPAGGCFILSLAFPFSKNLRALAACDTLPEKKRQAYLGFYRRCLQKHLYCHPGKRLLSKNAAFSTWCPELQATFPDASFLICIREPDTALSSQLSALAPARRLFATDPSGEATAARFTEIYSDSYTALARFVESADPAQVAVIPQTALKVAPDATLRAALEQTGIPIAAELERALERLPARPRSGHQHQPGDFPVDSSQIEHCMRPAYETMLHSPNCIRLLTK